MDDVCEVTRGVQSALETDALQGHGMEMSRTLHENANEVIGNEMDDEFFFDHRRGLAAQDVEGHQSLNLMEVQLDTPALAIKGTDGVSGVDF